ncbi:alpha/beta fold hydrolase [Natrialbaceae archaeon A-gly3]
MAIPSRPRRGWLLEEFPYVAVGSGPTPLLVVPGIGDAMFDGEYSRPVAWLTRTFFREFLDDYTIYMVSRPRGLEAGTSITDMAADYARVLEAIGPASVVGVSIGGLIVQDLALEAPELVDRLVIAVSGTRIAPAVRPRVWRHRRYALEGDLARIQTELIRETFTGLRRRLYPWLSRAFARVRPPYPADPEDLVVSIDAVLDFDSRERIDGIDARTLVIGGTEDAFFPESILRETHDAVPDAQLAMFRGARHGPFLERKGGFENWVKRFLAGEVDSR